MNNCVRCLSAVRCGRGQDAGAWRPAKAAGWGGTDAVAVRMCVVSEGLVRAWRVLCM